jgi:hypothetical protein
VAGRLGFTQDAQRKVLLKVGITVLFLIEMAVLPIRYGVFLLESRLEG